MPNIKIEVEWNGTIMEQITGRVLVNQTNPMAKIYGSESKYLINKEKLNRRVSQWTLYIVFLLSGFGTAYTFNLLRNNNVDLNVKIVAFIVPASIFFYVCYKLLYTYSRTEVFAKNYKQGSGGEDLAFAELIKLPDEYTIFRDVVLSKGNLDFIAVKGNQIFCIEVKSHSGKITFKNDHLQKNNYIFKEGDPIIQAWRQTKELKDFLKFKMGQDIPVVSLLVFSNPTTYVDIDPWKAQKYGVHILHSRMLNQFLYSYKGLPITINLPAVVEFLKPYINDQA